MVVSTPFYSTYTCYAWGMDPNLSAWSTGLGCWSLPSFACPPGTFGGRWGNRRMMIVGLSLLVIGCGLLPFAELRTGKLAGWVVVYNLVLRLHRFLLCTLSTPPPFAMKVTHQSERNHVFSVQAALWSFGWICWEFGRWFPAKYLCHISWRFA